jgi:hypothetical protein
MARKLIERQILLSIALVLSLLLAAGVSFCVFVYMTVLKTDVVEYSRIKSPDRSMEVVLVYTSPPVLADGRVMGYLVETGAKVNERAMFCSILGTYDQFVSAEWMGNEIVYLTIRRVDVEIEERDKSAEVIGVNGFRRIKIRYKL